MKRITLNILKTILLPCFAVLTGQAQAASLLLDFGPTVAVDPDTTNSPGHWTAGIPLSEKTWSQITGDTASGLVYSDGTAATGISVDAGNSTVGSSVINFSSTGFTSSALGSGTAIPPINTGVYTNTSPVKDGLFGTPGASPNPGTSIGTSFGVRIDGLPATNYTIFIAGRNTSTGSPCRERYFAAGGTSGGSTFDFSAVANVCVATNNSNVNNFKFVQGDNYNILYVTLTAGQSLYFAVQADPTNNPSGSGETRGFLNALEIRPGYFVPPATPASTTQPGNQTTYEGSTVSFAVSESGTAPITNQWYFNGTTLTDGPNIIGSTSNILVLSNILTSMAGNYSISASNVAGGSLSSNATLTVVPLYNTGQMTNLWNLLPGDRFYLTDVDGGERGLAYDPVTADLLVVCHVPTNNIVVLDPPTGAEKGFMNLSYVPDTSLGVNMIGVADDGMIYTCGATANAGSASTPFYIIQWSNDDPNTIANGYAFADDPGVNDAAVGAAGLRWGDSFAVRGSGLDTQLLCGPGSGTNVCLFTTTDGFSFSPNIITVSNVPSGFAQFGVAFGPGTNTFWAKTLNQGLYLVQFDLGTKTGSVIYSSTNALPGTFRFISTGGTNKWMAGIMKVASGLPDNVRLYDISSLTNGSPMLADQELYTTNNGNVFLNGAGAGSTAFGGNYLFSLEINNGIKAFQIDPNYTPALPPFSITSVERVPGPAVVLTWESVASHTYQVQSKASLTDPAWTDVGSAITATGSITSATNNLTTTTQLYRVQGN